MAETGAGKGKGAGNGAVSRRSAHVFTEELDGSVELGNVGQGQGSCSSDSRYGSGDERADREKGSRNNKRSSSGSCTGYEDGMIQMVDTGRDLRGLFPTTFDGMGKQGMIPALLATCGVLTVYTVAKVLQAAKNPVEGRPANFGVIIPGAIYRSSFPTAEDHTFLESLSLKTVV